MSASNDALENVCTLYGYDDAGNQITTTNALNQTGLTVYDGANRPFITVQNWDGTTTIDDESDCSFPPAESDTNVCSVTYFDELGRRSSSKDAMGNHSAPARSSPRAVAGLQTAPLSSPFSTIGTETSSVNRTFDDANQLLVSTDTELGITSFYYDGNGNLDQILPPGINPGEAGEQLYTFDQRNLITQYQVGAGGSVYDTVAEYVYDGDGNRVQQIDSSGATPITTTYTNDNAGMSQVLVSNDGTTTTINLFGLDLIQQDDGSETRTLLVDGLGSARIEMVSNTIETTTTYEPLLWQGLHCGLWPASSPRHIPGLFKVSVAQQLCPLA